MKKFTNKHYPMFFLAKSVASMLSMFLSKNIHRIKKKHVIIYIKNNTNIKYLLNDYAASINLTGVVYHGKEKHGTPVVWTARQG